ncbi:MAG: hypothetical protein K2P78_01690 [Gemmataceae bacterium]|nr:hypothetical protein [Gemmataceae bacterium]
MRGTSAGPSRVQQLFGFDPQDAAAAALEFVEAVRGSGWYAPASPGDTGPAEGEAPREVNCTLLRWSDVMNPASQRFAALDVLVSGWGDDEEEGTDDPTSEGVEAAAAVLLAAFLWSARFSNRGECEIFTQLPIPEGLALRTWQAASAVRDGEPMMAACPAGWPAPPPLAPNESAAACLDLVTTAAQVVNCLDRFTGRPSGLPPATDEDRATPDTEEDHELFTLWDRLEWRQRQIPLRGFDPWYPDVAWNDGLIDGMCAHAAALGLAAKLRTLIEEAVWLDRLFLRRDRQPDIVCTFQHLHRMGYYAVPTLPPHWLIPFWTPSARQQLDPTEIPRPNLPRWKAQLEIERVKLVKAMGPAPRVRCDPSSRSLWLDGKQLAAELPEEGFALVAVLADAYPGYRSFRAIQAAAPILVGVNPGRLKSKLPTKVLALIDASTKKGHALKLPPPPG